MAKKPDLDEATLRIARTLLNTPPKPHDEMKVGNQPAPDSKKARSTEKKRKSNYKQKRKEGP